MLEGLQQEKEAKWIVKMLSVKSRLALERRDLGLQGLVFLEDWDSSCFHINPLEKTIFLYLKLEYLETKAVEDLLLCVISLA